MKIQFRRNGVNSHSRKAGVISSILVAGTMISQVAALCGYFYATSGYSLLLSHNLYRTRVN